MLSKWDPVTPAVVGYNHPHVMARKMSPSEARVSGIQDYYPTLPGGSTKPTPLRSRHEPWGCPRGRQNSGVKRKSRSCGQEVRGSKEQREGSGQRGWVGTREAEQGYTPAWGFTFLALGGCHLPCKGVYWPTSTPS